MPSDLLSAHVGGSEEVLLALSQIREPHQAIRGPERHDPKYVEMRDSIRARGVYLPILVRPDPEPGYYILIDGTQRFTISRETGKDTIPARILHVTEEEALEIQIVTNLHRVETSPIQYASQLNLMMARRPSLTIPQVAQMVDKSPAWVYGILGLLRLHPEVMSLVERGDIVLVNAQALSKLPVASQPEYIPWALAQQPQEFTPKMTEVARRLKEGGRGGRKKAKEYVHVDHFQKMKTIKGEIDTGDARKALFKELGPMDAVQAWRLALEWVLHRDPISIRAAKAREAKLLAQQQARKKELDAEARERRGE